MARSVVALGSNDANAAAIFEEVAASLAVRGWRDGVLSTVIRTAPVGCVPGTPDFFNAVLVGDWPGTPHELLRLTQSLEAAHGRPADHRSDEARSLDIDLILVGDAVLRETALTLPHPRARERDFVLEPLREVAPELIGRL